MEGCLEPGPRGPWGPILGYEKSSAQPVLTWSIMLSFLQSHLQDLEHTKSEHKGEQAGDESWALHDQPQQPDTGHVQKAGLRTPIW